MPAEKITPVASLTFSGIFARPQVITTKTQPSTICIPPVLESMRVSIMDAPKRIPPAEKTTIDPSKAIKGTILIPNASMLPGAWVAMKGSRTAAAKKIHVSETVPRNRTTNPT
jgi:hypothetical protein